MLYFVLFLKRSMLDERLIFQGCVRFLVLGRNSGEKFWLDLTCQGTELPDHKEISMDDL